MDATRAGPQQRLVITTAGRPRPSVASQCKRQSPGIQHNVQTQVSNPATTLSGPNHWCQTGNVATESPLAATMARPTVRKASPRLRSVELAVTSAIGAA